MTDTAAPTETSQQACWDRLWDHLLAETTARDDRDDDGEPTDDETLM